MAAGCSNVHGISEYMVGVVLVPPCTEYMHTEANGTGGYKGAS